MHMWGRPFSAVFALGGTALLVWPIFGRMAALYFLSGGLALLLFHHLRNLSGLYNWLRDPRANKMPDGSGSWGDVFGYISRLMKRQRASEFSLSKALERFQRAAEAFPEAVILLDDDDEISWCNPRAEAYFGLRLKRDRGAQITYLLRQPQFASYLQSKDASDPLTLRLMGTHAERVVSIQLVPYGNSQKLLLGRDITRWENLETARRDFIANVSHELRTPLTVVHGYLETLEDAPASDPAFLERGIKLMSEQTVRMTRLVNDLLTLSRLESGGNTLVDEKVDVPGLLRSIQTEAQTVSAGRHDIRAVIKSNDWLLGNLDELRSAFTNLVTNAVRYTPESGVIEIRWERSNGYAVFSVKDNGIGIEHRHLARLTERFYRVDKSRSRETGGTGLGLAIVKHVANRHQAQLNVASSPGKGSTFSITFPDTRIVRGQGGEIIDIKRSASLGQ